MAAPGFCAHLTERTQSQERTHPAPFLPPTPYDLRRPMTHTSYPASSAPFPPAQHTDNEHFIPVSEKDGISGLMRHSPPRASYGNGIRCYTSPSSCVSKLEQILAVARSPHLCPSRRTGLQTCSSGPTIGHTIPILGRPTALKLLFLTPCGPAIRMLP
jgi:hypothetical protein